MYKLYRERQNCQETHGSANSKPNSASVLKNKNCGP